MSSKKAESDRTTSKERILQIAVELFARQGYGNTGLRELADKAGVNLTMINYFYGSKKNLLKEILDIFFSGYLDIARTELLGSEPTAVKLSNFIHGAITFFSTHKEFLLVTLTKLPHDDPEIIEHKALWGKQMIATIQKFLESADINKEIANEASSMLFCSTLTSMMASRFLFSPVMEQVHPNISATITINEYAEMISQIFLHGAESFLQQKQAQ